MAKGKYYRLNPHLDGRKNRPTMFELRDLAGTQLITSDYWGQDYLVAPKDLSDCEALEELMKDSQIYYEVVDKLPYTHSGYEI